MYDPHSIKIVPKFHADNFVTQVTHSTLSNLSRKAEKYFSPKAIHKTSMNLNNDFVAYDFWSESKQI
jgi:hypothetical protein